MLMNSCEIDGKRATQMALKTGMKFFYDKRISISNGRYELAYNRAMLKNFCTTQLKTSISVNYIEDF